MDIQALADQARESLGPYCKDICMAKCCKRGKLLLKESNVENITQKRSEQLRKEGRLTEIDGRIHLDLEPSCPSLKKDSTCGSHSSRPQGCKEYPLFIYGPYFVADEKCQGVKEGKINDFLVKLVEKGLKKI